MPKLTLLEITQSILSDMDSDNVNSINDTVEALQVAEIVKTSYNEIINSRKWPHLKMMTQLEASGDNTKPVWMQIPTNVSYIDWVKYDKIKTGNTATIYQDVTCLSPKDFLDIVMQRNEDATNITEYTDYNGTPVLVITDSAPTYYTSFDDEYIVFDSYDSAVDTTLQKSKTQVEAYKEAVWSSVDTFTPDLPAKAFPYLLAEAKSAAFTSLKQAPNPKEEQKARRQRTFLARQKWQQNGGIKKPDYGRHS